jgi:predicted ATPase
VSGWFSSANRFDSGYTLTRSSGLDDFEVAMSHLSGYNSPFLDEYAEQLSTISRVKFWNQVANVELSPSEVGVGLSQVLPLVVAAHSVKSGIVSIEQPELHIHPAFQVELGDLFTQLEVPKSRRPMFLIETHSEHLMLRLLRRIRETTDGELEKNVSSVKPEDISVIYLETGEAGIKTSRIEIDESGEFIQRWPNGFFAERSEELF